MTDVNNLDEYLPYVFTLPYVHSKVDFFHCLFLIVGWSTQSKKDQYHCTKNQQVWEKKFTHKYSILFKVLFLVKRFELQWVVCLNNRYFQLHELRVY